MIEICQKKIHSIFDSILLYPRFNSKCYSIQKKICWFNSKYNSIQYSGDCWYCWNSKSAPKSVQNRQKKGLFIENGNYRFKIWSIHSFHDEIQFKGLFNINFFRNIQSKHLKGQLGPRVGDATFFNHGGHLGPCVGDVTFFNHGGQLGPRVGDVTFFNHGGQLGPCVGDVTFFNHGGQLGPCVGDVRFV